MTRSILIAAGLALAVTLPSVSAQAQAIRTFVSTTGSDSNPCSITEPCRHFSAAVAATAVGGEVDALEPGAYGSFSISHAITIEGQGWSYVAPPSGEAAITITASSGNVFIHGVSVDGVGTSGTDGIALTGSASSLAIIDCVIQHFTHDGIYLQPTGSLELSIRNTIASNNGNDGIDLSPSGFGQMIGVVDHSMTTSNGTDGMNVYGANTVGGILNGITIVNSVSTTNGANGIKAYTTGNGLVTVVMVRDTTSSYNAAAGFFADGTADMIFAHSEATANSEGIYINTGTGASGQSFGDNHINGNLGGQDVFGTLGTAAFH
jgi:hypothetical protein